MLVASWNIEKNGQSSELGKQSLVDNFIFFCCKELEVDVLFLCEVHSARMGDYASFAKGVYSGYDTTAYPGGHSNCYLLMLKQGKRLAAAYQGHLRHLNRGLLTVEADHVNNFTGYLHLAHFKSGQNQNTAFQLQQAANCGHTRWAIAGDMNWDIANAGILGTAGIPHDCWQGQGTRGIATLDWVLAGIDVRCAPLGLDPNVYDMTGPDHRPIIFQLTT